MIGPCPWAITPFTINKDTQQVDGSQNVNTTSHLEFQAKAVLNGREVGLSSKLLWDLTMVHTDYSERLLMCLIIEVSDKHKTVLSICYVAETYRVEYIERL